MEEQRARITKKPLKKKKVEGFVLPDPKTCKTAVINYHSVALT